MHQLRRFARDNVLADGPLSLDEGERRTLAARISTALGILDTLWEGVAGRKLTDEEKGL